MTLLEEYEVVRAFVERVNRKAARKMAHTGKLEGSHYAAMREELSALKRRAEDNVSNRAASVEKRK